MELIFDLKNPQGLPISKGPFFIRNNYSQFQLNFEESRYFDHFFSYFLRKSDIDKDAKLDKLPSW